MGPKGIRSILVGYAPNIKTYGLLNLESNVIVESRNLEFFENWTIIVKDPQITTYEVSCEEGLSKVVEKQLKKFEL